MQPQLPGAPPQAHRFGPTPKAPEFLMGADPNESPYSCSEQFVTDRPLTTRQVDEYLGLSPETVLRRWGEGGPQATGWRRRCCGSGSRVSGETTQQSTNRFQSDAAPPGRGVQSSADHLTCRFAASRAATRFHRDHLLGRRRSALPLSLMQEETPREPFGTRSRSRRITGAGLRVRLRSRETLRVPLLLQLPSEARTPSIGSSTAITGAR